MSGDVVEVKEVPLISVQVELPRPPSTNESPPMQGKDQTLTNVQRSTPNSAGKSQRTAAERQRLLPRSLSDIEVDPHAVAIAVPGNYSRANAMPQVVGLEERSTVPTLTHSRQIRPRGPQPKNTLNLGSQKAPQVAKNNTNASTTAKSTLGTTGVGHLSIKPVVGDNVLRTSTQRSSSASFDERPKKRAKVNDNPGPKEVVTVEDDSAEDELHSDTNTIRVERSQAIRNRMSSVMSHRTGPFLSLHQGRQTPPGYNSVNNIMDSSGYPQYIEEQRQKGSLSREPSFVPTAKLNLPASDSTAVDGPREISKSLYKGTARTNAQPRQRDNNRKRIAKRMQTEETSRHFVDPSNTNGHSASHRSTKENSAVAQSPTESHSPSLREQFTSTDGKRRGSGSSDPLADGPGPVKYAEVVRVSPRARPPNESVIRSRSPTAIDLRLSEGDTGLPKSNIRPSRFISLRPKQPDLLSVSKQRKAGRKTEGNGFACTSVSIDRRYVRGDNIGLVIEDGNTDLTVYQDGENLTQESPTLRVRTQKILRIIWSQLGRKVRLELSQTAHEDRIVDLELLSEKYASDLIRHLVDCVQCEVVPRSREIMDKMFANRLKDECLYDRRKTHSYEHQDTDIKFLTRKKERRDEQNQASTETSNTKRRRVNDRVADRLQPNHQNQESQTQFSQAQEKDQAIGSKDHTVKKKNSSGTKDLPAQFNFRTVPNTHLTRSSLNSSNDPYHARELSLDLSDFPEEFRFSIKHGLGPPWRKPLVYPKEGKKKTTVDQKDLERLDEGQFLNDNLIGFYLRYLECELMKGRPDMAEKVYWFNTYFFASLTKTTRGKRGINYEAVRKWTRGVDIFNYEYAVVPINESAHWYVAIICNLPALQRIPDNPGGEGLSSPAFPEFEGNEGASDVPREGSVTETKREEQDASQFLADLDLNDKSSILDAEELEVLDPTINGGQEDPTAQLQAELLNEGVGVLGDTRHGSVEQMMPDPSVAVLPLTGKVPASQKKTKRKSIPPIKRIDPDQPAIITLDSLGLSHPPTIRILKDYLLAEANDKRGGMQLDDGQIKGTTAKGIPQQDNFCDCGLFLLGYIAKFVEDPRGFVHKILQREYDEIRDWANLDSTRMRENMRNLIQTLHAEQHTQSPRKSTKGTVSQGAISRPKASLDFNKDESRKVSSENKGGEPTMPAGTGPHTRPQTPLVNLLEALATALDVDDPIPQSTRQEGLAVASGTDISAPSAAKREALARTSKVDGEKNSTTRDKASAPASVVDDVQPPTSRQDALASALSVDDPEPDPLVNVELVRDLASESSQGVASAAANAKESSIVIQDSQPEVNEYALIGADSEVDPKSSECKLEPEMITPSLPPRPMVAVPSSPKRRENMREVAESPERRTRTTITIDDN